MPIRPSILAVDDHPRNLAILERSLGQEFNVHTCPSGVEALERAPKLHPDLILLDIMMPELDGYETCRRLRKQPELVDTKIIMVSAKAMTSERLEGYEAGADDYVVKPFDPDELLAKVRVYVRLKSVEEVDRLKSDLLNLLSHETGTPLTGIMGGLALLRDAAGLTDEQSELLEVAEVSTLRLHALVERVKLITRLKAESVPAPADQIDLAVLTRDVVEHAARIAEAGRVSLIVETGEATLVTADGKLVQWALDAMLDNAIRVSPRGSVVTVRAGIESSGPYVSISDQGPGIEPELLPHVFDEFVVADIHHHKKGSGLSLAATRLIALHHGGALSVETEVGRGSVFRFSFPSEPAAEAAA